MDLDLIAVLGFLKNLKIVIEREGLIFIRRPQNEDTLAYLEMDSYQVEEIFFELTPADYIKGTERDHDGSEGDIYKFVKEVTDIPIYIKLKLEPSCVKCLSFKRSDRPVVFPLRKH